MCVKKEFMMAHHLPQKLLILRIYCCVKNTLNDQYCAGFVIAPFAADPTSDANFASAPVE